ncbi:hypothetical protein N0M98_01470 [Paenibacillus doosanensis]|uniref:hypothetical protein n=1 Tax=Paenibacillus doosanensis TaxID=1229154 RepID=UPI002180014C|nr:hypothetical protein [Paenibacillus doosanensis]MCS7458795.1 hypothetical protein [Paenibacillus doosanensis]
MKSYMNEFTRSFIDDHLDLYRYAVHLGDQAWADELLETLRHYKEHVRQEMYRINRKELWRQFDAVNLQLLQAYNKLQDGPDEETQARLHRLIRQLKLQRIAITNQICVSKQAANWMPYRT